MDLVELIKALAHENRLRILNLLKEKSLCVCELRNIMDINQSNASRHLKKLKNVGLVESYKEAQWVYYQLSLTKIDQHPFIKELLEKEFAQQKLFQQDKNNLELYNKSKINCDSLDNADLF